MSPTLLHQTFKTDRRLEVSFSDPLHYPLYIAEQMSGVRWVDTELIPLDSDLYQFLRSEHIAMKNKILRSFGQKFDSLDDSNPKTQKNFLTLEVAVRSLPLCGSPIVLSMGFDILHATIPLVSKVISVESEYAAANIFDYLCGDNKLPPPF